MLCKLLKDSLELGEIWVTIKGSSMEPFFKNGSQILVRRADFLLVADILVYMQEEEIISHRLIRKRRNKQGVMIYQTKPDNGFTLDGPVGREQILGKVVAFKNKGDIIRLDNISGRLKLVASLFLSALFVCLRKYANIIRRKGLH